MILILFAETSLGISVDCWELAARFVLQYILFSGSLRESSEERWELAGSLELL